MLTACLTLQTRTSYLGKYFYSLCPDFLHIRNYSTLCAEKQHSTQWNSRYPSKEEDFLFIHLPELQEYMHWMNEVSHGGVIRAIILRSSF